jgi:hypothetical protein
MDESKLIQQFLRHPQYTVNPILRVDNIHSFAGDFIAPRGFDESYGQP